MYIQNYSIRPIPLKSTFESISDGSDHFHVLTTLFQSTSFANFTRKRPVITTLQVECIEHT